MISLLAALSVLSPTTAAGLPYAKAVEASDAPVRLWMNSDRLYREGSKVRVQVDSDIEGYLLVLNYDPDGRVRVLFPLDPRDDAAVHAGRRYEVRDDDGGQAFIAGGDGTGLIYAAVAQDPWRFDEVTLNGGWDLSRLEIDRRSRNPEQDLTEVVQKIAGPKGFDYDVMGYRVYGDATYSSGAYPRPIYPIYPYDDLYCNNWYWRYNGCSRWPYDGGWSFGTSIYLGFGSFYPYYYDPFYSPFYYRPYRPFGFGGYYPYGGYYYPYGTFGGYLPSRPRAVVVGRPRGYTIRPFTYSAGALGSGTAGVIARSAPRGGGQVAAPPINWRARAAGRSSSEAGARGPSRDRSTFVAPPARRARSQDMSFPAARGRAEGWSERGRGSREDPPRAESPRDRGWPARAEPSERSAPPRRAEPSGRSAPPPREASGGHERGGGGGGGARGGGGGGGGGGHSAPSRGRRP
jgi:hypothetical protein